MEIIVSPKNGLLTATILVIKHTGVVACSSTVGDEAIIKYGRVPELTKKEMKAMLEDLRENGIRAKVAIKEQLEKLRM